MATNKEVFENGLVLDHYPCDLNEQGDLESNGSIENIVEYKGRKYSVITDFNNNVRWENKEAQEINSD